MSLARRVGNRTACWLHHARDVVCADINTLSRQATSGVRLGCNDGSFTESQHQQLANTRWNRTFPCRFLSLGSKSPEKGHHKDNTHPAHPSLHQKDIDSEAPRLHDKYGPPRQDRGEDQPLPSAAPSQPQASVGDEIKADVVRLVTEDGASRELTLLEALHEAQRSGKALVQVSQPEKSSGGTLVVCKLVTHIEVASAAPSGVRARKGAWKEAGGDAKKEQGNGAKSMQFSMTTSDHDKATKLNRVVGFLNAGKAVRIVVKTSGKNRASQEEMEAALLKIVGEPPLSEIAEAVDSVARRKMEASVTISPIGSTH